jgi:hypothetical protein
MTVKYMQFTESLNNPKTNCDLMRDIAEYQGDSSGKLLFEMRSLRIQVRTPTLLTVVFRVIHHFLQTDATIVP